MATHEGQSSHFFLIFNTLPPFFTIRLFIKDKDLSRIWKNNTMPLATRQMNKNSPLQKFLTGLATDASNSGFPTDSEAKQLRLRVKELEAEISRLRNDLRSEQQQASRDPLTGIPNRRAYEERLREDIARSERNRKPMSLLVWDIDLFKKINDRHGHQTGDQILIYVAKKIASFTRKNDFTARIGGEEFVSILSDCDLQGAHKLAELLREEIAKHPIVTHREEILVTISCGVAQYCPGGTDSELFAEADGALYRAKQMGRNSVCLAEWKF
jgi:diguanylate cyclase